MPRDMWKPEDFPIKLEITPDGDKFKCVVKLGDNYKFPPVYGKTAVEALAIIAVHLVDKQIGADMIDGLADQLVGLVEDKAGSRE